MAAELTLGAEEELHLIDLESGRLSARAPQILSRLPAENYSAEIQRTTVETNTEVVTSLDGLRQEILRLRRGVIEAAAPDGVGIACVGTAPRSEFADFELTASGRYGRMQQRYRLLVDEQLICGTQIHVGVSDRDLAVEIAQRVARDLPVLLAISASSPYWNGQDTGYSSIRTLVWQRWPSAGATGPLGSAAEYDELLADLIATGVISDSKMAYFEVRPSSHAPTLELRVCDACPVVDDAVLIAGLFRASVRAAELDIAAGRPFVPAAAPLHRAAMWQAARSGLSGDLLDDTAHPRPTAAGHAVRHLIRRLRPQLEELGDHEEVLHLAEALLTRGNSADRQRAAFAERGSLDDVVRLVVDETHGPASGLEPTVAALRSYRTRAGDEAVGAGSRPRAVYEEIVHHLESLEPETVESSLRAVREWTADHGLDFGVDGETRPFEVDLVPRIITAHEWNGIAEGVRQRARALEAFLRDVYGEQRILADGVLPRTLVESSPGYLTAAGRLPGGATRAAVIGFDLVRDELGSWRVLEDNLRNPSGAAYAVAIRRLLDEVAAGVPRPEGLASPEGVFGMLRATLEAGAATIAEGAGDDDGPRLALVSSGPAANAWFEHRTLAEAAGLRLLTLDDLVVEDGLVRDRGDGARLHALYLRLDDELPDAVSTAGERIGAAVLDVAAAGGVFVAGAPGNGVADDKALYGEVPSLIAYYLGERPLLEQVPTYRTADELERRGVLERVGELVTKPVDGHGGSGVLVGPAADAQTIAARRAEISADPGRWVAQEVVALSSHPTFVIPEAASVPTATAPTDSAAAGPHTSPSPVITGPVLEPRHVDLRVFVYATGASADPTAVEFTVAPLALTRVAPAGSMVVNSSRGGGAKDTWILR
ncbi:carboxylate--amine ligase/circularly permuted type 2 ATP-grasp protein [Herbiconiux moechotypicola]|uniref:Putative glutamate--cysteine ligase 2 n=1 Tax=Herbiconiux moechotypicola TaxID=637393 RepID=A0ABP5QFA8_9MICO|nr:carboxylate--amine ligase/circularly permuted type 2 ATP-grasp protein [Herbiconiux moechotypicola]MCS5729949.1 carboxylate--amine ligase/circularly permuted type 2 ATP-grasp protein [Herbiconiux moechotypicola]